MKFEIKNRWSGEIIYQDEAESFKALILSAIKAGANLSGADLWSANLRSADLWSANLRSADLRSANLSGADLSGANLRSADLRDANLRSANLSGANLSGANLRSADLRSADLRSADLRSANLSGADLWDANLRSADLQGANLRVANLRSAYLSSANLQDAYLSSANLQDADLSSAKNISDRLNAETSIVPETGGFQGWKKCQNNVIVRLRIPASAKRSSATGRKCRAERALVLEVIGAEIGESQYKYAPKVIYKKGKVVACNAWNPDRWAECGGGIHFFLTRYEAENYK